MKQRRIWIIGVGLLASSVLLAAPDAYRQSASTQAASAAYETDKSIVFPVDAKHGMVVSEQRLASEIGLDILKKGGNAVDAAVATAFALAVVLPNSGNIGGGGFILTYRQYDGKVRAIDFRETAPKAAVKEIFLHPDGSVIDGQSVDQPYASGVPGTVAGLEYVWKQSGHLPWASLIEPAIQLAERGVPVTQHLADNLRSNAQRLSRWPSSRAIFFKNGKPLTKGDLLIQKDLANSLRLIAKEGSSAFYKGVIADKIDAFMRPYHWINKDDLAHYQVVQRQPIYGDYRGYKVVMMPPPSSGGVHILQILNILSHWDIAKMGQDSAQEIHYFAEAAKRAYADREKYLGDPAFVTVPVKGLISKHYADILAAKIGPKMTSSTSIKAGYPFFYQGEKNQTTHLSVVDKDRNAVALTYTLNGDFGNGAVVPGTGIMLNNEMDDFSFNPKVLNMYGVSGGAANQVAPGKRPLSSMSPTIVLKDNQLYLVTGSPGGARIITTVAQILINDIDFHLNPAEAIAAARVHHQRIPDELRVEKGLNQDTIGLLKQRGYKVVEKPNMGRVQTIKVDHDHYELQGASDTRNPDGAALGY